MDRICWPVVVALAWMALGLGGAAARPPDRFDTVVIDAGHGGDNEGAKGARGLREKELVLDVGRKLAARLRAHGLQVVMTRSDDRFVPLETRTSIANDARADLFLSIHANATNDRQIRGVETFFLSLDASDSSARAVARRENAAFRSPGAPANQLGDPLVAIIGDLISTEHLEESNEFARLAQAELSGESSLGRGVKQAHFVVLEGVRMPASLVEIGFLTNAEDERELRSPQGRERIVTALVRATLEFARRYDERRGVGVR